MLIAAFNPLEKYENQIGSSQLYQLLGMPVHHSCSKAPRRMAIFHGYSMAISPWRPGGRLWWDSQTVTRRFAAASTAAQLRLPRPLPIRTTS